MSLPKSPTGEWYPYLSRKPLTNQDYEVVAHALGLSLNDVCLMQLGPGEDVAAEAKAAAA